MDTHPSVAPEIALILGSELPAPAKEVLVDYFRRRKYREDRRLAEDLREMIEVHEQLAGLAY